MSKKREYQFLFCGRKTDRLKALIYEGDGFTLAYKRLSSGRYNWPGNTDEAWKLSQDGQSGRTVTERVSFYHVQIMSAVQC